MEATTSPGVAEAPPRRLFAIADFRRLWTVGAVIFLVRWLEMLAVSLFVWEGTHSAFLVAMMGMLRLVPMGLFGAVLGVWAERVDLRRAMIAVVLVSGASSAVLALLAHFEVLEVWHLALGSLVNGFAWAADNPVRRMMIGSAVGSARMGAAMSADVGSNNASRMLGPTLSGVIFALFGVQGAFFVALGLYALALHAALAIAVRAPPPPATGESLAVRLGAGIAVVRRTPALIGTLLVTIIFNICGWPITSIIPVVAQARFGLGPEATGLLVSMDGVGAFLGALAMAAFARPDRYAWLYLGGVAGYLCMIIAFALAPTPWLAGAALLLMGFSQAGFSIMQATLVYLLTPAELRSRVLGILSVCIGLGPLGFIALGLAADWLGASSAALATGLIGLAALGLTHRTWRAILRHNGGNPA